MKRSSYQLRAQRGADDVAADWAVRRSGGLNPEETAEFLKWIAADPRHPSVLATAELAVSLLRAGGSSEVAEAVRREVTARKAARRGRMVRFVAWTGATMAAAAALLLALRPASPLVTPQAAPVVATVEVRPDRRILPDGSVVQLNAGADIRVEFTAEKRAVELVRGDALFSVMKDAARPFVVSAAGVEVRAVGTAFLVQHGADDVKVLVTEGRVAVARAPVATVPLSQATAPDVIDAIFVGAGGRVSVPLVAAPTEPVAAVPVQEATPTEIDAALAWREKRVEFTATPVGEAVEMLNRENRTKLAVQDPALAAMRLSGIFWKDDPAAFAALIEMSFGAAVQKVSDESIILTARRSAADSGK